VVVAFLTFYRNVVFQDLTPLLSVGGQGFIEGIKKQLNRGCFGRKSLECDDSFILRETSAPYSGHLPTEKGLLNSENSYYLTINDLKSSG
jgi:hypothetical protein